jgi:hypothetical protein
MKQGVMVTPAKPGAIAPEQKGAKRVDGTYGTADKHAAATARLARAYP